VLHGHHADAMLHGTDGVPLRSTQLGARLGCPAAPGSVTAGDSAGDGWGQPELSVRIDGGPDRQC
jgi:hypothetical protein